MSDSNKKSIVEQKKINPPTPGRGRHFMMEGEKGKLDHPRKELWKFLFSYLKSFRVKLIIFIILMLIGTAIMAFIPLIVANIIDNGIIAGDEVYLRNLTMVYLILLLVAGITNYFAQYGMGKAAQKVVYEIRNDLFFKLQHMSLQYFDQRPSGDIISILTNDIDQLNQLVGGQFVMIITSIVSIVLSVIFMYMLNPLLATISLIAFPIFIGMMAIFRKFVMGAFKESREAVGKITSSIQENIEGARVVQAYGQEEKKASEFDIANKANYEVSVRIRRVIATLFPFVGLITTIITVSIILVGGLTIMDNVSIFGTKTTVGVLSAFIIILAQFFRPFMVIMGIQAIIEAAIASTDRIYSLLGEKVEIPDSKNPKNLNDVKGEVQFIDVSFGYSFNGKENESDNISQPNVPEMQNPLIKRVFDAIRSFPEPYSSFFMKNIRYMPQNIRRQLFMSLMGSKSDEIPQKIDKILSEYQFAVPNTKMADLHPDYKISFKETFKKDSKIKLDQIMVPTPEMILMMVKRLETTLHAQTSLKQSRGSGGMSGESGNMMGGKGMGMGMMTPQEMLRMLATMPIKPDLYERIPKIVKDAINEQKKLIQREQSRGYVLKNVNLKILPNTTVAIVGETGAGKTTSIKLLSRFYDINNGSIRIDGVDIRDVPKIELRGLIGLVPQDSFIFTGTIRDNLLYAFENIIPEIEQKMIQVSKFLGLHNFVETLHKKYDTKLKENGANISIGQRQLICFARALITDPKILILDEATSSVDPYTETLIQDALNKARSGRTTIIIAHRLSTIKNADHIVVLGSEKKGIIEEGTHESLLALNGKYKRLLDMQFREIAK